MKRWLAIGMMCSSVASGVARPADGRDWPMRGYDATRRGASPAALDLPETLHLQWTRELPPPRRAWPEQPDDGSKLAFDLAYSPIAAGGRVYVASMNTDCLTAYSLETGEELWRFYTDGPIRVAPAAWDDKVYLPSDDGHLYCLDAASGKKLWSFRAGPTDHRVLGNTRVISFWPVRGGPAIQDGTVYFASGVWPFLGTFVFALDAKTGEVQWSNTGQSTEFQAQPHSGAFGFAGIAPQGYVSVGEHHLVVAGGRAWPAVFDRKDGSHRRAPGSGWLLPVHEGFYYSGRMKHCIRGEASGQNYVDIEHEAISALNARLRDVGEHVDGRMFDALVASDRLLVSSENGRLYCFGPDAPDAATHVAYAPQLEEAVDTAAGLQAAALLKDTGVSTGYALLLGAGDGELILQLVARSALHVVALEPDPEKIQAVRERLDRAGVYGARAVVLPGRFRETHYPLHISSLILAPDPQAVGLTANAETLAAVYEHLRPHGGQAVLGFDPSDPATRAAQGAFEPENGRITLTQADLRLHRDGGLPGAGQWTHQYADPAQTSNSRDKRVRPPFGPIWYGGVTNHDVLPRHTMGPRPQVAAGRLVVFGFDTINARCVFTGHPMWSRAFHGLGDPFVQNPEKEREEPGSGGQPKQPGATYIGSPYVTLADAVYLRHQGRILRLDPETGMTVSEWRLPTREPTETTPDWGHISVSGDRIIATANPHIFRGGRLGTRSNDRWDGTSSERLVVLDRHTGAVLWTREAEIGFRHNAIVSGNGRLYVSDRLSDEAVKMARRRGMTVAERPHLLALDIETGNEVWAVDSKVFGAFLNYCVENDILIEGGSSEGRRLLSDENLQRRLARRGSDGSILWDRGERLAGPTIVHGKALISNAPGRAISLLTGERLRREHPATDGTREMRYWSHYGCGGSNAGEHILLFRSGAAGFADVTGGSGTGTIGGFRAGCTANLIPADGVLNAPDYTRGCVCAYQNQTSLGLIHMPELEVWMANQQMPNIRGTIRRVGVNLGAPGNRLDERGVFWVHHPRQAPSPEMDVTINALDADALSTWHKHALFVNGATGINWVAASGMRGLHEIILGNIDGQGKAFDVTLHFAEPDGLATGQRTFDIHIQGQPVAEAFDVVREAGDADQMLTRTYEGVKIEKELRVTLTPSTGSEQPPILSGVELMRQEQ